MEFVNTDKPNRRMQKMTDAKTRKTPAEVAQAELDVATRVLEKAEGRVESTKAAYEKAKADVARARYRADFLSNHPDLRPVAADDGEEADEADVL